MATRGKVGGFRVATDGTFYSPFYSTYGPSPLFVALNGSDGSVKWSNGHGGIPAPVAIDSTGIVYIADYPTVMAFMAGYLPGDPAFSPVSNNGWGNRGKNIKTVRLPQAGRPSESILCLENTYLEVGPANNPYKPFNAWTTPGYTDPTTYPWATVYPGKHMGGHNHVYVDGHAKWSKIYSLRGRQLVINEFPQPNWTNSKVP